jgi:hypothetical protein
MVRQYRRPFAGAWIETLAWDRTTRKKGRPFAGAWIETSSSSRTCARPSVAPLPGRGSKHPSHFINALAVGRPFAGAWIESLLACPECLRATLEQVARSACSRHYQISGRTLLKGQWRATCAATEFRQTSLQQPKVVFMLTLLNWNLEWKKANSRPGREIMRMVSTADPYVICLTESYDEFLNPSPWHSVYPEGNSGYPTPKGRRKVILGSKSQWTEKVADLACAPPGGLSAD